MKEKKASELENYEKEYLSRLNGKKSTKSLERKKPADTKTKKPRKSDNKKGMNYDDDDTGVVLIDDDLELDEQTELEERKAYLEEARSQDSSD